MLGIGEDRAGTSMAADERRSPWTTDGYRYTEDLVKLDLCRPETSRVPVILGARVSPLKVDEWERALARMPDRRLAEYIIKGIRDGFRVGFQYRKQPLRPVLQNMPSARANKEPVQHFLEEETRRGRIAGPLDRARYPKIMISRFGVIPKSQPGKWRLILDLSSPTGQSVNDGIDSSLCSFKYINVDDAAAVMVKLGRGAMMAKIDIAHAYRNVPIHPQDRQLLGMQWEDKLFVDKTMPFGMRSAPKIFSALADTLEWVLLQRGVSISLHYLDDFLTLGAPGTRECQRNLRILQEVCALLGFPLAAEKIEGPTTALVFLGIILDSTQMEMRLPETKLQRVKEMVAVWQTKKKATKRQVLSLVGLLAHAAKVVTPGRTFIRRMINLAHTVRELHHWVYLNGEFKSDLQWWHLFLEQWNGKSCMASHCAYSPSTTLVSDASGSWGCGALWGKKWLQLAWVGDWAEQSITVKELLPIVIAVALWGEAWTKSHVLVKCDNMAVVHVLASRTSRHSRVMHLLRCLYFLLAKWEISVHAEHIPGVLNTAADAISRDNMQVFRQVAPQAHQEPAPIPTLVMQLLVTVRPDWTSPDWRSKLKAFYFKE